MHKPSLHMRNNTSTTYVYGVVVIYHPDLTTLEQQLKILSNQVNNIVIINNGPAILLESWITDIQLLGCIHLIQLRENFGLAYAQNVGIEHARSANATHIAIFDQDSLPEPNMISHLLTALYSLQSRGIKVAAVAPNYRDNLESPLSGFVRTTFLGFKRILPDTRNPITEADFLISSGSLIPVCALNEIGTMESDLFIDHIDTEWCFRASSKGYRLFGVANATMTHSLGNHRSKIWFIRWRTVPYHSPFRYYYIFRNSCILMRRKYIPLSWKISEISRNIRALFFYGIFSKDRIEILKMMIIGLVDGINNRTGRL